MELRDLKIGDFVRTKYGIKQIYEIDDKRTKYKYLYKLKKQDDDGCIDLCALSIDDIIKASDKLIDLVDVGDYVNGLLVEKINQYLSTQEKYLVLYGNCSDWENEDIKSVLTHEQMEQMSYTVGE